jgi:hypothetical protein
MPLRDSACNQQVCAAISKYDLFSKQNIQQHVFESRLLSMRFLDFISSKLSAHGKETLFSLFLFYFIHFILFICLDTLQLSTEVLPHPSRTLIFDGKRLLFGTE